MKLIASKAPMNPRKALIEKLISDTNKRLEKSGSQGRVYSGRDIRYVECERLPSGSLGLDLIMGGGFPRSRLTELWGEESSGKTTACARAVSEMQKANPHISVVIGAAEGFNKDWWRVNEVYVPYSDEELGWLKKDSADMYQAALEYNKYGDHFGSIVVQQIMAGDMLLEEMIRYIKSNLFDVAIVDSFGTLRPASQVDEEDEKYRGVGDPTMGGNGSMFARFCGKLAAAFNTKMPTPEHPEGEPNRTCVIGINQVRAQIGGWNSGEQSPTGGYALRHQKDVSVHFTKGPLLKLAGAKATEVYGRKVRAECTKNKTAEPFRRCEFEFHFKPHAGIFGINRGQEVALWGVYYGLIEQSGAHYYLNGEKVAQGMDNLGTYFNERPDVTEQLSTEILRLGKR